MSAFGCEAKTFVNATPDALLKGLGWVEANIIRNVTVNDGMKEVDVTNRSCGGYEQTDCYFDQPAIDIDIALDPDNAAYQVLETAHANHAPITAAILAGPSGTSWGITALDARGPVATWNVTGFEPSRPINDIQRVKVKLKPLRNAYDFVNAPTNFMVDSNSTSRVIDLTWDYDNCGMFALAGYHVRYTTGAIIPLEPGVVSWTSLADAQGQANEVEYTMNPAPSMMPTRVQIQAFTATATGAWIEGAINSHA